MVEIMDLDLFDRHILEELQRDARAPIAVIADRVGLSQAACYRRVRALRASPAIVREAAVVAPARLGWPLAMIVLVTLERESSRTIADLMGAFEAEPEIGAAWQVTGEYDFVLHVFAQSMESYDALAHRLLSQDDRIRTFHTHVVIRQKQGAPFVPLTSRERVNSRSA